jgi:hypothetical protein
VSECCPVLSSHYIRLRRPTYIQISRQRQVCDVPSFPLLSFRLPVLTLAPDSQTVTHGQLKQHERDCWLAKWPIGPFLVNPWRDQDKELRFILWVGRNQGSTPLATLTAYSSATGQFPSKLAAVDLSHSVRVVRSKGSSAAVGQFGSKGVLDAPFSLFTNIGQPLAFESPISTPVSPLTFYLPDLRSNRRY